jgi:hypothetical protein
MMRLEVQAYLRASAKLFGLAHEEGALTLEERAAIVSFAQEIEKKFLLSREETDVPLSAAHSDISLINLTRRTVEADILQAQGTI